MELRNPRLVFDRWSQEQRGVWWPYGHPDASLFLTVRGSAERAWSEWKATRYYDATRPTVVDFTAENDFNAAAGAEGGVDLISITKGACETLSSFFSTCISEAGDECQSIVPGFDGDKLKALFLEVSLLWLFMHELGHISDGHIEYVYERFNLRAIDELKAASVPGFDSLTRQTLEMDADCFATHRLLMRMFEAQYQGTSPDHDTVWNVPKTNQFGTQADAVRIFMFANYAVWRHFAAFEDFDISTATTHPPARIRYRISLDIVSTLITNWKLEETSEGDDIMKAAVQGSLLSEKLFGKIYGANTDKMLLFKEEPVEDYNYHASLHNRWFYLRSSLDPNKRGGTLTQAPQWPLK